MEIIFKLTITFIVGALIYYQIFFLKSVWESQLDPKATVMRIVESMKPSSSVIAMREPNFIYQEGDKIGEVLGEAVVDGNRLNFASLVSTTGLDISKPIEYQRFRLKVISIESRTGQSMNMTEKARLFIVTCLRALNVKSSSRIQMQFSFSPNKSFKLFPPASGLHRTRAVHAPLN